MKIRPARPPLMADWAQRKGLGERPVSHARLYVRLAAERMGDLYSRSEKAKGAAEKGTKRSGERGPLRSNLREPRSPTLKDLGVSKKEMAEAQFLAKLPKDIREDLLGERIALREAKRNA